MAFNEAKCKIVHVGNNNPRTEYFMSDRKIDESEEEKDERRATNGGERGGRDKQGA